MNGINVFRLKFFNNPVRVKITKDLLFAKSSDTSEE